MILSPGQLRPVQSMVASLFFKYKRLMLSLPRQFGGKTELGVRISYDITSKPFTSSSLFLAKDKKSGKKATREKFQRIFDKSMFEVNTEQVYLKKLPSSVIWMDSVDKDPDRIRGGTHSFIHWSEVAFSKIEKGETISGVFQKVVDPTTSQTDGYCLLESTNNGKNGWYDLWHSAKDIDFFTFCMGLWKFVEMGLVSREEYERIKKKTQPDIFRQEYECEWVSFQGKTYIEFDSLVHIDANMPGPEIWQPVISAIDWGWRPSATCVLFAYVENNIVNVFDEHYSLEELPAVTAMEIENKKSLWDIRKLITVADHDLARNTELQLRGINCGQASKANVMGARMTIKELLWRNQLKIHPRCVNLIRDLEAAVWDVKKEGEIDYTQCTWGHFDGEAALRYLLRELSEAESQKPDDDLDFDTQMDTLWKDRA
jgi:hypothetical protein